MPEGGLNQLQQEIASLEKDLASKRQALIEQKTSEPIPDKQIIHELVEERIQASPVTPTTPAPITPTPTVPTIDPPSYLTTELKDQVQSLVNLAFNKSISEAIQSARTLKNPALLDAFHDALTDELYDRLVEQRKL